MGRAERYRTRHAGQRERAAAGTPPPSAPAAGEPRRKAAPPPSLLAGAAGGGAAAAPAARPPQGAPGAAPAAHGHALPGRPPSAPQHSGRGGMAQPALQADEDGGEGGAPYLPEVPPGFEASASAPQARPLAGRPAGVLVVGQRGCQGAELYVGEAARQAISCDCFQQRVATCSAACRFAAKVLVSECLH